MLVRLIDIEHTGFGHVPQFGVLLLLNGELVLKSAGREEIFPTHQEEIF